MNLFKRIIYQVPVRNYGFLFLILFVTNNSIAMTPGENLYSVNSEDINYKINVFYSQKAIQYSQYDNLESQLKVFFGYDPVNPEDTLYPDLTIINDSAYIRDLYGKKLNDMTINKKIYNINK
tara:strand:- start:826 stop:1191 length:366 start_codon:yes stop_codon:yes gene_type:complete